MRTGQKHKQERSDGDQERGSQHLLKNRPHSLYQSRTIFCYQREANLRRESFVRFRRIKAAVVHFQDTATGIQTDIGAFPAVTQR